MKRHQRSSTTHPSSARRVPLHTAAFLIATLSFASACSGDDGDDAFDAEGGQGGAATGGGSGTSGGIDAGKGGSTTGGRSATGGAAATGGSSGSGSDSGGSTSTGGKGGKGSTGGRAATGGNSATGGSTTPPEVCGDLTCDESEACDSCEIDCGTCEEPPVTECNDGIDNDGDGLVDWQLDVGCWSDLDGSEAAGSRDEEKGWTTFDLSEDSRVVYVSSSDGDDSNDGSSPENAVATPARGNALVRDGFPDFLLFKRGDTWRNQDLGNDRAARRFKSGRDLEHPIVIGSYGDSRERPRLEVNKPFLDDDGHERNYLAIVGLALISYPKVPGDDDFNGADGGGLRFVGTGHDILVEDLYVEYGEFTAQSVSNISFRRNVVYRSYHVDTCLYRDDGSRDPNGNNEFRPAGIYSSAVNGLVLEGNVFDENGWNPDVEDACATIYNHNMYLSRTTGLVVKDNLLLRASSIGLKMESGQSGGARDILVENNLFAEGEIGLSMGGNSTGSYRFVDAIVRDNVFTDIGRTQPTNRGLSWYLDIEDNDNTEIVGNLLVNQPDLSNSTGIHLKSNTNRNISIHDNLTYNLRLRDIDVDNAASFDAVSIFRNTFVQTASKGCIVDHSGAFDAFSYAENSYRSNGSESSWFCVGGERVNLDGWVSRSNEDGAQMADLDAPEPTRNLDSYAEHLGVGSTLADFAAAARKQSRHRYREELTAKNANNYIRAGFGRDAR